MIRYVLAAILAVLLLAMSVPAVDYAAGQNTDRHATNAITEINDAAVSLLDHEEVPPPGHPSPQRVVTITLPDDSLTSHSLDAFKIERVGDERSIARYQYGGRAVRTAFVDAPIVESDAHANRTVVLVGTGEQTLALTLETDENDEPVIVVSRV